MAGIHEGNLGTVDHSLGRDLYLICGLFDLQQQCKDLYFWANACGLNFRFREESSGIFVEDRCNFLSSIFSSVYPFEAVFAYGFSKRMLSLVKDKLEPDPGLTVDILVEWKAFAMLIFSSNTSIPADINLYINSKEYSILF
jgi:hypothetical protein